MPTAEQYLRPEVIKEVSRLDLKAKFIVEGFYAGLHQSPYHGFSTEFSEHRRYSHGDDLKDIDWNVYAKTDKFYIKKFQAETNLTCHLVVDMSESMAYTYRQGMTKLEYATCLAAALGYLMISQQDAVGLVTFDEAIRSYLPAKSKRGHLVAILAELSRPTGGHKTELAKCLHEVGELMRERGLVIIFSDLLADPEPVLDAFHHIKYRGHDIIVFHVLDEAEVNFPFDGATRFEDVESPEQMTVDPRSIRRAYLEELKAFTGTYSRHCEETNIDYVLVDTAMTFDKALTSYLINRQSHF